MKNWKDLKRFAEAQGFFVTSTTGGKHNRHSKHFLGLAVDVRTRGKTNAEIELFIGACRAIGVRVIDERKRPINQKVWSGSHLHLDIGAATLETLRNFQKRNGLIVDGILGEQTMNALDKLFSES